MKIQAAILLVGALSAFIDPKHIYILMFGFVLEFPLLVKALNFASL